MGVRATEATEGRVLKDDEAEGATKGTSTRHLQQCITECTIINIDMIVYSN